MSGKVKWHSTGILWSFVTMISIIVAPLLLILVILHYDFLIFMLSIFFFILIPIALYNFRYQKLGREVLFYIGGKNKGNTNESIKTGMEKMLNENYKHVTRNRGKSNIKGPFISWKINNSIELRMYLTTKLKNVIKITILPIGQQNITMVKDIERLTSNLLQIPE